MDARTLQDLCDLARLELSAQEQADFAAKFERLLGFVDAVQSYAASADGRALPEESLTPRSDKPESFDWPAGTVHDYRVPQVIDFEGPDA